MNVIAASRGIYRDAPARLAARTGSEFILIEERQELTVERLRELNPDYVFLPHWSYIIPEEVFGEFECVVFHMTDLPFGRGGSPLQNLIVRGIQETKVCALRCGPELDAGPVYLRRPLCLHGSAEEVYLRAAGVVEGMIEEILATRPIPVEQAGEPVVFRRRKPADGDIGGLDSLGKVFDHIRMLDAEGYPPAFLDAGPFRLEFTRASLKPDGVIADVRIVKR